MTEVTTQPEMGTETVADLIGELTAIERPFWADISAGIPAWHPRGEGDDGGDGGDGADEGDDDGVPAGETAEQAALRKANAEAKKFRLQAREAQQRLKEHEDAGKTELERAQGTASEATSRATAAELKALKYEIAAEHNIPLSQALRLQGSDEASIAADAKAYAKELGVDGDDADEGGRRQSVRREPDNGAGVRRTAVKKPESMNERIFAQVRGK